MARRSTRNSSANVTPTKAGHTPIATSKGAKRSRATPTKSQYFKEPDLAVEGSQGNDDLSAPPSPSTVDAETSGYEDEDVTASEPSSADESEEFTESETPPRKKQKRGPAPKAASKSSSTQATPKAAKGRELWRQGTKLDLEAGTEVILERPKARPAGKTPYKPNTIHPNTMLFLADLVRNNDREWLKWHDPDYRTSWNDFTSFLEGLQEKLIEADETIPELPTKDIVFRIYRDIRFSKDPTPYKTHFSAAWSRTGRKGPYAAYYVQIKPGGCFVGGGLWHPEAQPIAKLRRDIDRKPHRIKRVLVDEGIRREFFGGVKADEEKAVKAFTAQNKENALKSKPKGFDADHENIELLRLRNFTIGRKLGDEEVVGEEGLNRVAEVLSCLVPFVGYLNNVVMPDQDESSSDEDDGAGSREDDAASSASDTSET